MKITIEIADFTVTSREQDVAVAAADFTPEIWARLAVHGAVQKIADAASGAMKIAADEAKVADADVKAWKVTDAGEAGIAKHTLALMGKAYDGLVAGEWSTRSAGLGVDLRTRVARSIMRAQIKAKVGAKSPAWATFTGLSDDEQNAKLDANIAANAAALEPAIDEELRLRAAKRAAKNAVGTMTFNI